MASLYSLTQQRLQAKMAEASEACAFGISMPEDLIRWQQGRAHAFREALQELAEANKDAER